MRSAALPVIKVVILHLIINPLIELNILYNTLVLCQEYLTMPPSWLKELGDRIKVARKAATWSQGRLAKEVGVSRTMISLYETGKNPPSLQIVASIATALKTEFVVQGCRISAADAPRSPEGATHQLCLELEQDYTVTATLVVRPVQGAIHLGGLAKVPKRA